MDRTILLALLSSMLVISPVSLATTKSFTPEPGVIVEAELWGFSHQVKSSPNGQFILFEIYNNEDIDSDYFIVDLLDQSPILFNLTDTRCFGIAPLDDGRVVVNCKEFGPTFDFEGQEYTIPVDEAILIAEDELQGSYYLFSLKYNLNNDSYELGAPQYSQSYPYIYANNRISTLSSITLNQSSYVVINNHHFQNVTGNELNFMVIEGTNNVCILSKTFTETSDDHRVYLIEEDGLDDYTVHLLYNISLPIGSNIMSYPCGGENNHALVSFSDFQNSDLNSFQYHEEPMSEYIVKPYTVNYSIHIFDLQANESIFEMRNETFTGNLMAVAWLKRLINQPALYSSHLVRYYGYTLQDDIVGYFLVGLNNSLEHLDLWDTASQGGMFHMGYIEVNLVNLKTGEQQLHILNNSRLYEPHDIWFNGSRVNMVLGTPLSEQKMFDVFDQTIISRGTQDSESPDYGFHYVTYLDSDFDGISDLYDHCFDFINWKSTRNEDRDANGCIDDDSDPTSIAVIPINTNYPNNWDALELDQDNTMFPLDPIDDYTTTIIASSLTVVAGVSLTVLFRRDAVRLTLGSMFGASILGLVKGKKSKSVSRDLLLETIQDYPGISFSELKKLLKWGNGHLAYHLSKLEKEGEVVLIKNGKFRQIFYWQMAELAENKEVFNVLREMNADDRIILKLIETHNSLTLDSISELSTFSKPYLKRLLEKLSRHNLVIVSDDLVQINLGQTKLKEVLFRD